MFCVENTANHGWKSRNHLLDAHQHIDSRDTSEVQETLARRELLIK